MISKKKKKKRKKFNVLTIRNFTETNVTESLYLKEMDKSELILFSTLCSISKKEHVSRKMCMHVIQRQSWIYQTISLVRNRRSENWLKLLKFITRLVLIDLMNCSLNKTPFFLLLFLSLCLSPTHTQLYIIRAAQFMPTHKKPFQLLHTNGWIRRNWLEIKWKQCCKLGTRTKRW